MASDQRPGLSIPRMIYPVVDNNVMEIKRTAAFKARDIDSIFIGVGAALMVCIDTAPGAEIMFRLFRIELVQR
jgi:hypothetical protein